MHYHYLVVLLASLRPLGPGGRGGGPPSRLPRPRRRGRLPAGGRRRLLGLRGRRPGRRGGPGLFLIHSSRRFVMHSFVSSLYVCSLFYVLRRFFCLGEAGPALAFAPLAFAGAHRGSPVSSATFAFLVWPAEMGFRLGSDLCMYVCVCVYIYIYYLFIYLGQRFSSNAARLLRPHLSSTASLV